METDIVSTDSGILLFDFLQISTLGFGNVLAERMLLFQFPEYFTMLLVIFGPQYQLIDRGVHQLC